MVRLVTTFLYAAVGALAAVAVAPEPAAAPTPAGFQLPPLSFRATREPAMRAANSVGSSDKTADSTGISSGTNKSASNGSKSPFSGRFDV